MNNFRRTAIASIINLTLLGAGNAYADDNSVLEKRIRELEKRLQQLDKASALPSASVTATTPVVTPEVEKLTRKVNTLGGESLFLRKIIPGSCSINQQKLRDRQCLRLPRFVLLHSLHTQQGLHSLVSQ